MSEFNKISEQDIRIEIIKTRREIEGLQEQCHILSEVLISKRFRNLAEVKMIASAAAETKRTKKSSRSTNEGPAKKQEKRAANSFLSVKRKLDESKLNEIEIEVDVLEENS